MAALAALADVEALLGRAILGDEASRAETLLDHASALVRGYCRQAFDLVPGDQVVLRPVGTLLRLPQRPVTAVTAVAAVGGHPSMPDVPLAGWTWDGSDLVDIRGLDDGVVVNLPAWWDDFGGPGSYRVTYDHGYTDTPADVVAVVAMMAARTITAAGQAEGLVAETIGSYSYQLAQGGGGTVGPGVRLTAADRQTLDAGGHRRRATTVSTAAR